MHYIYLLQSLKDNGFYIGRSGNLRLRYTEHKNGKVTSTKNRRPLELVYYESYKEKSQAIERETKLKLFGSAYTGLLKRLQLK